MPIKTIYWLCGVLVLVALGFYGYTKWQEAREKVDLWTLVPDDAVFVVESNNVPRFLEHLQDTDIWNTVSKTPYVRRVEDHLTILDSISTRGRTQLRQFLTNKSVLVSLHVLGKTEYEEVYFVPVNTVAEHRYIRTLVESTNRKSSYRQEFRDYQGFQITDVISQDKEGDISFFTYRNNLIISPSSVLIEEIIRKINRGQLESPAKDYKNINYLSQPDVYANVFINYQHLPDLLGLYLKKDLQDNVDLLSSLCHSSMLQMKLENNRLLLNGFSTPEKMEGSLYHRLQGQKPKRFQLRELLPDRAAIVLHMGMDKMGVLRATPGTANVAFLDTLANSFSGELGLCFLEAYDTKKAAEKVLFVQSSNPVYTSALLNRMQPGRSAGSEERHGKNTIRLLTTQELPQQLFGETFKGFEQTYYTSLNGYIIFTDDVNTMRTLLTDIDEGKVWGKSEAMQPLLEEAQQEDNLGLFIHTANAWNLLLKAMSPEKEVSLLRNASIIKKFNLASMQFSAAEQQYYTSLLLRHQEESAVKETIAEQGLRQEESFSLKNTITTSPFLTQHPIDKSDEQLVQDSKNVLYALNNEGKINWSDTLSGPLMGRVQQVTYGPDHRLKYLFATPNHIYCIDKNGRDLENFPFNLGDSLQLQGLSIFDYEKNGNYLLAADDNLGNLFLLDMQGNLQPGFSPMNLEARLAAPPQHFKVNGRDVILVLLENGIVYAFNPGGEALAGFPINLGANLSSGVSAELGVSYRKSTFTTVTQKGQVVKFDLTGDVVSSTQLIRTDRRSIFELVPEPGGKSYIVARLDPGRVALYSQDLKLLLDRRFVTSSRKVVQYFHFGGDRKLYVITETGPGKAYLFDVHAKPLGNDPINTSFPVSVRYNEVQNQYTIFAPSGKSLQKIVVQGRD